MKFIENILDVLLHRARTAAENFADLAVAFAGGDPLDDFELALGERTRRFAVSGGTLVNFR